MYYVEVYSWRGKKCCKEIVVVVLFFFFSLFIFNSTVDYIKTFLHFS